MSTNGLTDLSPQSFGAYLLTYLLTYSLTYLPTYLLTYLLTYLPTYLPTYLLMDFLPQSFGASAPNATHTYFAVHPVPGSLWIFPGSIPHLVLGA